MPNASSHIAGAIPIGMQVSLPERPAEAVFSRRDAETRRTTEIRFLKLGCNSSYASLTFVHVHRFSLRLCVRLFQFRSLSVRRSSRMTAYPPSIAPGDAP